MAAIMNGLSVICVTSSTDATVVKPRSWTVDWSPLAFTAYVMDHSYHAQSRVSLVCRTLVVAEESAVMLHDIQLQLDSTEQNATLAHGRLLLSVLACCWLADSTASCLDMQRNKSTYCNCYCHTFCRSLEWNCCFGIMQGSLGRKFDSKSEQNFWDGL